MISDWQKQHEPEDRTGVWDERARVEREHRERVKAERLRGNVLHRGVHVGDGTTQNVFAPPNISAYQLQRLAGQQKIAKMDHSLQEPEIDPVSMVAGAPMIAKDLSAGFLSQGIKSLPKVLGKEAVTETLSHTPYYIEQLMPPSHPVSYAPPREIPTSNAVRRVGQFTYGQDRI
tara:strand:+ start:46 stop:567 length:522 start_codon:yes stop_codon:yes gene_type:complete